MTFCIKVNDVGHIIDRRMYMKFLNVVAWTIAIIGAVNWGLIGAFEWNLVDTLFGVNSLLSRLIYILVGLSGIYLIMLYPKVSSRD